LGLSIVSNIGALSVARHLQSASRASNKGLERLASGLRINSSKDDAAGTAISDRMGAQIRGLSQATRNANDAISVAKTAEGALQETSNLLQRIRELAVQSANDTLATTDRASINTEVQALLSEVNSIASQTNFNGLSLLDGTFTNKVLHIGGNTSETMGLSISNLSTSQMVSSAQLTTATTGLIELKESQLTINGTTIGAADASDDTVSIGFNAQTAIAKAAQINRESASTNVTATVLGTEFSGVAPIQSGGWPTGALIINGAEIDGTVYEDEDATGTLRDAINAQTIATGVTASVDTGGTLKLTAEDGRLIRILVGGFAATTGLKTGSQTGGLKLESTDAIVIGGTNPENAGLTAGTFAVNQTSDLADISLATQTGASEALVSLDKAIEYVSSNRAEIGATLNRLESVVNNLRVATENSSSARSQVRDTDWAMETAQLSKAQILQQAAASMASQANVTGRLALQLLES
jgi:flagellin